MSLHKAIDVLLAHVPEMDVPADAERDWRKRFDELDSAVWVEACKLGYEDKLPPETHDDKHICIGLTNLPVTTFAFGGFLTYTTGWRTRLLALRTFAQTRGTPKVEDDKPPKEKWSEAKSPAEWRKQLKISATTLQRHVEENKLVVDKLTTKSWRIRLDTLERYVGNK